MPAVELKSRFANKSLSPVEVLRAYVGRAEKVNDKINAFSHQFVEKAEVQARAAEQNYLKGRETLPLEGIPVAIKDEGTVAGMPCTNGSLILKDFVASETTIVNQRVIAAGAIIHARTTTPEFSCAGYTHSKLWGVTRNPWNLAFTPGGSSGGAGAALAAGTTALATGSDIGGSVRIPASASGVCGFKPPYGRNPAEPPFNLDTYCHSGPMARTVDDAILLQNVLAGPHAQDIASLKPKFQIPMSFDSIAGWQIAYSYDLGCYEVDPAVRENMEQALAVFRDLGVSVNEVDIDWPENMLEAGIAHLDHIFGVYINSFDTQEQSLMTDYAKDFANRGAMSKAKDFYQALEVAGKMYQQFGPILERHHLFICPTNAVAAVPAEHDQSRDTVKINGKEVDPLLGWVMTLPFNMLSRCPVLSIPSGFDQVGVPTGIQLVGRAYQDADVFQAGMAFQNAVGGFYREASQRPKL